MGNTTQSAVAGAARGIAPYLILAGLVAVIYFKRDAIVKWFSASIASPVTGAISDTWGAVTSPFVSAGQSAGQWWYETTNPLFQQAQADNAFVTEMLATHDSNVLDDIIAAKTPDQWADPAIYGLSFTVVGQTGAWGAHSGPVEQKDAAITYTSEEMSTMSKGLTESPGSGYVVRGQSITGADLFRVGPWTKVGVVTIHDPSGDFTQDIWKNPIGGALTVGYQSSGISWSNFQRIERQLGRTYDVVWL